MRCGRVRKPRGIPGVQQVLRVGSKAQEGGEIKSKEKTWGQQRETNRVPEGSPKRWNRRS